ncbi:hypothetical protein [uncultured Dysosmobacter sp.]|nr:hypothetical protein [uncultured Dysosmobacter sp.]
MAKNNGKKDVAGGLGILAAAMYLCLKGLKKVDERLRQKKK